MNITGLKKKIKEVRGKIKMFEKELQGQRIDKHKRRLNFNIINAKEKISRLKLDIRDLQKERKRRVKVKK